MTPIFAPGPRIPLCWPDDAGRCGCGRGHQDKHIGKAPLVAWTPLVTAPPTAEQIARWAYQFPAGNWGLLLEPAGVLVIDCDSEAARGEAISYGMPPAITDTTGEGSHAFYLAPESVAGRRTTKRGYSRAIDILAGGLVVIPPSRHRSGRAYQWIVAPDVRPLTEAPNWAVRMLFEATTSHRDLPTVALPGTVPDVALEVLHVSPRMRRVIVEGGDPRYTSRSEAVFACVQALIIAGYDDPTIAGVLLNPAHGISAKPRALGRRWLTRELARARLKGEVEVFT